MQLSNEPRHWTGVERCLFRFIFSWVLIFLCSFSFPHQLVPDPGKLTAPLFEKGVRWFGNRVLLLQPGYTAELISDSTGLYIQALLVVLYAGIITLVWSLLDRKRRSYRQLSYFFYAFIRYYLALQLFTYGFSKLFKWQFYLPEPNTLYTKVGDTYKDLLYWTSMGSSRGYSIFLGATEVIAAALLLWRRTYTAGALLSVGICINIVAVNFAFDISVKLYSLLLLLLSILLLLPFLAAIFRFFFLQQPVQLSLPAWQYKNVKERWIRTGLKLVLVCSILADALYPYISSGNFNDDKVSRPLFHGAYRVDDNPRGSWGLGNPYQWKRVFIHRQGYFIAENRSEQMKDYQLKYDTLRQELLLNDYEQREDHLLRYSILNDSTLSIQGRWKNDSIAVLLRQIDLEELPLLQKEFHWTIDEY